MRRKRRREGEGRREGKMRAEKGRNTFGTSPKVVNLEVSRVGCAIEEVENGLVLGTAMRASRRV